MNIQTHKLIYKLQFESTLQIYYLTTQYMYDYLKSKQSTNITEVSFSYNTPQSPDTKSEKKGPFCRKKLSTDSSLSKKTLTLGYQSNRQMPPLQRKTSIDKLKLQNSTNNPINAMKYMSPIAQKTPQIASPARKMPLQLNEKFIRQVTTFSSDFKSQQSIQYLQRNSQEKDPFLSLKFQNSKLTNNSQYSADSSDWVRIQNQNEFLKKQKKYLQNQVYQLKQILKEARIELPMDMQMVQLECNQCHNKSVNFHPIKAKLLLSESERQPKGKAYQLNLPSQQIENMRLRDQLQQIKQRLQAQNKTKIQLCQMIQMFKSRYEQSTRMLQNYNIKLNVLLRQKAQYQGAMVMADKINKQRQNLRKTLSEYKQKITILTKAMLKSKKHREEEKDISLDLSTSIDIY